jgi:hypothetical protein
LQNTPARLEHLEHLAVERALSLVLQVMDRKRGDDGVEPSKGGQRGGEVVLEELYALHAFEALARLHEHGVRDVEPHAGQLGPVYSQ